MTAAPPASGLLPILKQPGLTSHDVVDRVRKLLKTRRVGHAGTLDPGAAGVLVVLVGQATRLAQLLQAEDKTYVAEMCLGTSTDTQDGFGRPLRVQPACKVTEQQLHEVSDRFVGPIRQVPPMTSAVRQEGKRLYQLARDGMEVDRPARQVFVDYIDLLHIEPVRPAQGGDITDAGTAVFGFGARVTLRLRCSKGTYVRTLCHDMGEVLGCGAWMSFLLRTTAGAVDLTMTRSLDDLESEAARGPVQLLPVDAVLAHIPATRLQPTAARGVRHGQSVNSEDFLDCLVSPEDRPLSPKGRPRPGADMLRLYDNTGALVALAGADRARPGLWRPRIVFSDERGNAVD